MTPNKLITNVIVDIFSSGIYMILCVASNKAYIGRATKIKNRWEDHKRSLKKGSHYNYYLQSSWDKYGKDNFLFVALENCPKEDLYNRECFYTAQVDEELRFNLAPIIDKIPATEEYRKNLSEAKRKQSIETRKKIGDSHRGMKHTEESKLKMSNSAKGRIPWNKGKTLGPLSEETKAKLSAKLSGENNPFYGKTHSKKSKMKISKASKKRTKRKK